MSVYIPNISEIAVLKSILLQRAMTIGLYVNSIIPDGSTLFATLTEMTTGAGYVWLKGQDTYKTSKDV